MTKHHLPKAYENNLILEKMENQKHQKQSQKWYYNPIIINLLLVLFFPVGLYLLWKSASIQQWWKVTATIIIAILVIANLSDNNNTIDASKLDSRQAKVESKTTEPEPGPTLESIPTVGDKLRTDYFEISLNKVWIDSKIKTGNQFSDLGPEAGSPLL